MNKEIEVTGDSREHIFTKGMTLDQYMAKISFDSSLNQNHFEEEKQQNLFESSKTAQRQCCQPKTFQYSMEEIDQESADQSIDLVNDQLKKDSFKEQKTKETFREVNEVNQNLFLEKPRRSMNSTAYFKNSSNQKNNFRIKHISNSPAKKKSQVNFPIGSMTLYGVKFNYSKQKQHKKIPDMMTFYGKIAHGEALAEKKGEYKKADSKRNFKKKNCLQLHELIQFETKIKNNFSQKVCYNSIRIDGTKDRLTERKNKFC